MGVEATAFPFPRDCISFQRGMGSFFLSFCGWNMKTSIVIFFFELQHSISEWFAIRNRRRDPGNDIWVEVAVSVHLLSQQRRRPTIHYSGIELSGKVFQCRPPTSGVICFWYICGGEYSMVRTVAHNPVYMSQKSDTVTVALAPTKCGKIWDSAKVTNLWLRLKRAQGSS